MFTFRVLWISIEHYNYKQGTEQSFPDSLGKITTWLLISEFGEEMQLCDFINMAFRNAFEMS